jgi:hypothetical protein
VSATRDRRAAPCRVVGKPRHGWVAGAPSCRAFSASCRAETTFGFLSPSVLVVPLSELEAKVWPIWEGIKAAESLRHAVKQP